MASSRFFKSGWPAVLAVIVLVFCVRIRLLDMPLERDEGEYAYAGQLILQGIPPYKDAYNMKLPGTYAAYAVILGIFGQTAKAVHLGVALMNAASIVLVFGIGRKVSDEIAAASAAVTFGLLSSIPAVFGLAGHATHFVTFFALVGIWFLLRATSTTVAMSKRLRWMDISLSGFAFGLAFLMKQHGVFFSVFATSYLGWLWIESRRGISDPKLRRLPPQERVSIQDAAKQRGKDALFGSGFFLLFFILPYALTCLLLAIAGVFPQFVFWTITYAAKYATAMPGALGNQILRDVGSLILSSTLPLWLTAIGGAIMLWRDKSILVRHRFFLVALLIFSMASVVPGFYFRPHYFITLLPAVALLAGIAVSRSVQLLRRDKTIELFVALPVIVLFGSGCISTLIGAGSVWFRLSPIAAAQDIYRTTLFADARDVGRDLREKTQPDARIAVIGSEPEIYFYARRKSATGYIYTYPLVESHPFARKMQENMSAEIEANKPEYCVFIQDRYSWLMRPGAELGIFDWWKKYWATNLTLLDMVPVKEAIELGVDDVLPGESDSQEITKPGGDQLLVLRRKGG
jgi:hypothetical protein